MSVKRTGRRGESPRRKTVRRPAVSAVSAVSAVPNVVVAAAARAASEPLEERRLFASFLVDTNVDEVSDNGLTSLREAVLAANASPGADDIRVQSGTFTLAIPGAFEDGGRTGDLDITDSVSILGAGQGTTTIHGGRLDRVFHVIGTGTSKPTVRMQGLTVTGGLVPDRTDVAHKSDGGGIQADFADLALDKVTVQGNQTGTGYNGFGGRGGGVNAVGSTLTLRNALVAGNRTANASFHGGTGGGVAGLGAQIIVDQSVVTGNQTGDGTSTYSGGRGGGIYAEGGTVTVRGSRVTDNVSGTLRPGTGGGINTGPGSTLVVEESVVAGNRAGFGGGIAADNGTTDRILNSAIVNNTASGWEGGGGLYVQSATVRLISGTTIAGNRAVAAATSPDFAGHGGGISVLGGTIGEIANSTISGNTAGGHGGGIDVRGNITRILNTTIANNAAHAGGGLHVMLYSNVTPTVSLMANTILADNTAAAGRPRDVWAQGAITTAENNLVEDPAGHAIAGGANGNVVGVDPGLAPLANNGGPTATHALPAGSPAIDAGRSLRMPLVDQRGLPRPVGAAHDIGAYERQVPPNAPPVAAGQQRSTPEDVTLQGTVTATDADFDALTYAVVAGPAHGTLSLDPATGGYAYTPAANYHGPDAFTFRASDGTADSNVATVAITVTPVNDAPVGAADAYAATEDESLIVVADGVLANDVDADGNGLSAELAAGPAHGSVSLSSDGTFLYTPAPNFAGSDAFTYRVTDGAATSGPVTVTITVAAVNDEPALAGATFAVAENSPAGTAVGRVAGTDVDGDPLTYSLVGGNAGGAFAVDPATGTITVANPALLDYETTPRFGLTVRAADPSGASADAAVTVDVTDVAEVLRVAIDVRPGDASNTVSARKPGKIEVAVLSTATFDARRVDVNSLTFGRTGTEDSLIRHPKRGPQYRVADVNGDGRLDLVATFDGGAAGFQIGDTAGLLRGRLLDGSPLEGVDRVTVR